MTYYCDICGKLTEVYDTKYPDPSPIPTIETCEPCREYLVRTLFNKDCPPLYQESDPSRLPQEALIKARFWTMGPKGLILIGPSRVGKTRIMWLLLKDVLRLTKPIPSLFAFNCVSFGHDLARHYHAGDAEDWLETVGKADLVFFDDLGKEKLTERAQAELFGVMEYRMSHLKPILATTEHTAEGLADRVSTDRGPALVNRLREACVVIPVP
jgi:DNA replication protein DnaC